MLLYVYKKKKTSRTDILLTGVCESGKSRLYANLVFEDAETFTSIKENIGDYEAKNVSLLLVINITCMCASLLHHDPHLWSRWCDDDSWSEPTVNDLSLFLSASSRYVVVALLRGPTILINIQGYTRLVDIPGHERLRGKFVDEYKGQARGVVYVVDSSTVQKDIRDVAE